MRQLLHTISRGGRNWHALQTHPNFTCRNQMEAWTYHQSLVSTSHACQLLTSQDPITQHVAKLRIQKEENQQRQQFKPMLVAREVMVADPGASRKALTGQVKKAVKAVETAERLDHAKGQSSQGELHHLVEDDAATLWSETVQQLPPDCLMQVCLKCRPRYLPTQC